MSQPSVLDTKAIETEMEKANNAIARPMNPSTIFYFHGYTSEK